MKKLVFFVIFLWLVPVSASSEGLVIYFLEIQVSSDYVEPDGYLDITLDADVYFADLSNQPGNNSAEFFEVLGVTAISERWGNVTLAFWEYLKLDYTPTSYYNYSGWLRLELNTTTQQLHGFEYLDISYQLATASGEVKKSMQLEFPHDSAVLRGWNEIHYTAYNYLEIDPLGEQGPQKFFSNITIDEPRIGWVDISYSQTGMYEGYAVHINADITVYNPTEDTITAVSSCGEPILELRLSMDQDVATRLIAGPHTSLCEWWYFTDFKSGSKIINNRISLISPFEPIDDLPEGTYNLYPRIAIMTSGISVLIYNATIVADAQGNLDIDMPRPLIDFPLSEHSNNRMPILFFSSVIVSLVPVRLFLINRVRDDTI